MNEVLRIEGLSAGYGDYLAIEDIDLAVRPRTIAALLGANGMGKTTLLRAVAGLVKARAGEVLLADEPVTRTSCHARVRRGLAYVPERGQVVPRLTVQENLTLGGLSLSRAELGLAHERVLATFPALRPLWRTMCWKLSGGEQQMVAVGRALMQNPKLLMMDEPSLGLAPLLVAHLFEVLHSLQQTSELAILVVEQNFRLAAKVADQLYFIKKGRIVLKTDRAEIAGSHRHETILQAYLGA